MANVQSLSREMEQCIQNCLDCYRICLETISYCLEKGGKEAEPAHVRLLLDCVEICRTSAGFMIRRSDLHPETCAACAVVCEACAEACEAFRGDAQMTACAEVCRRCAESCRRMAGTERRKAA